MAMHHEEATTAKFDSRKWAFNAMLLQLQQRAKLEPIHPRHLREHLPETLRKSFLMIPLNELEPACSREGGSDLFEHPI